MGNPSYQWIPVYQEIARQLRRRDNPEGHNELIALSRSILDKDWSYIDPFAFFIAFNTQKNNEERVQKIRGLMRELKIEEPFDGGLDGIVTIPWVFRIVSHNEADSRISWELFDLIVDEGEKGPDNPNFERLFDAVAAFNGNENFNHLAKTFFMINPNVYFPLQEDNIKAVKSEFGIDAKSIDHTARGYVRYIHELKNATEKPFWEISHAAYLNRNESRVTSLEEGKKASSMMGFENGTTRCNAHLNTILYGPPGTGKTFNSLIWAYSIAKGIPLEEARELQKSSREDFNNELADMVEDGQIQFVTFHQSYSYEDFIEGIKPKLSDVNSDDVVLENGNEIESDNIDYRIEPGVFRVICDRARAGKSERDASQLFEESWGQLVDSVLRSSENQSCTFYRATTGSSFDARLTSEGSFRIDWKNTYTPLGKESIKRQWADKAERPTTSNGTQFLFDARNAIIDKLVKEFGLPEEPPSASKVDNCVLIIDEINRGNISKIFGELITLIEEDKRSGGANPTSATLPYSHDSFSVPSNLFILGTMNTADRSIALMDTALRRRFEFEEMMPDPEWLDDVEVEGVEIGQMLRFINKRIEVLYDREHAIGHAYFSDLKSNPSLGLLASVFKRKIIPLLQEYFYDDYEKIRQVLADDACERSGLKFVRCEPAGNVGETELFFRGFPESADDYIYAIQENAFDDPRSYIKIYDQETCLTSDDNGE